MAARTLVLGIGNNLLSDEGVGVHAVNRLQQLAGGRDDVTCLDGGTLSFTLAGPIAEHEQLIVVDAARLDLPPGSVRVLEGDAMDAYLQGNRESVHEVGLMDLFDISRLSGHFPRQRALVGVQPASLDWGEQLTESVAPAVDEACAQVLALVERWAGEA